MSCPDCFKGSILEGEPTGTVQEHLHGAYFAPAGDTRGANKRAIVLLTDIFGLPLKNCKILADEFAKRLGCDVWVPDIFAGKPFLTPDDMKHFPRKAGQTLSVLNTARFLIKALSVLPSFVRHRASVVDGRVVAFMNALQAERQYDKIGVIGYCFGGGMTVRLGASSLFDSIVVAHPSPPKDADVLAIKAPTAWLLAEEDFSLSRKRVSEIEALYADRATAEHEFISYPGTAHGFAARPDFEYPDVKAGFEKALNDSVAWFEKTLPV
ncbi:unnamed protein product [Mycena citricolor]|uniref:Dienelactone hydrolase domain-containing protein n=1 Tax=Mycena citricolor TaxID=2018698 RepID=A0AAD2H8H8_9AGAR|nr:unnamed protein product [Mycena citricolor]